MQPTTEELRELAGWEPPLGVLSVYLDFDPADRTATWLTELRNGLERIGEEAAGGEHERLVATRASAERLLARFEDERTRPPPRGEAGFVEVAEKGGGERWWPSGAGPDGPAVTLAPRPLLAPLVDVGRRGIAHGVAVISSERVRLLLFADGRLEELEDWELSYFELDWRERKAGSSPNPASEQGVSSSGHDRYEDRLEHNRERFLAEAGRLAGDRLREHGVADVLAIGPTGDWRAFEKGIEPAQLRAEQVDSADLISVPTGQLLSSVEGAVERVGVERDRAVVEQALGEGRRARREAGRRRGCRGDPPLLSARRPAGALSGRRRPDGAPRWSPRSRRGSRPRRSRRPPRRAG